MLSGQILIRCRDRRRTARLVRRAPLPGNPEHPYLDGCGYAGKPTSCPHKFGVPLRVL